MPAIRGLLYSIFRGSIEDMEDAEQEILFALYANIGKYRFESSFRTFLFRFARNKAIDLLRGKKREKKKEREVRSSFSNEAGEDPDTRMIETQKKELLLAALCRLDESERSLIVMKEQGGCSVEELARVFGIPAGTVKSRLHGIRKKLYLMVKEGMQ